MSVRRARSSGTFGRLINSTSNTKPVALPVTTGGVSMSVFDQNKIRYIAYTFTSGGTITFPSTAQVLALVVGGGAGGSGNNSAWGPQGGNGGVQQLSLNLAGNQTYNIAVGGAGAAADSGGWGGDSSITGSGVSVTSTGGRGSYGNGPFGGHGTPTNNSFVSNIRGTDFTYAVGPYSSAFGSGGSGYPGSYWYRENGQPGVVVLRIPVGEAP